MVRIGSVGAVRGRAAITTSVCVLVAACSVFIVVPVPGSAAAQVSARPLGQFESRSGLVPRSGAEVVPVPSVSPVYDGTMRLTIPALKRRARNVPIFDGVSRAVLNRGIGHFPWTEGPGEVGNFAVSGHRATYGEEFAFLPSVKPGSVVIIDGPGVRYTYRLDKHQIVKPNDIWVTSFVPGVPGRAPVVSGRGVGRSQLITLVTCQPRWGHTSRFVYWGHLISVETGM